MKYSSLKNETVKVFEMPVCNKGVDLTNIPENTEDGYLAECKNIWFKDGKIVQRSGINAKSIISEDIFEFSQGCNYTLTDTTIFYEGEYYKIATAEVDYDDSSYFIYVYLISDTGKVKNIGYMHFGRTSDDVFYIPYKCLFYVGASVSGGGIFALVSLYNREDNTQTVEKIYEIGADYNSWYQNYNYYIPTVYMNGRGNAYELAKKSVSVSTAAPTVLESLNTLNGTFYAYYTSDGYSSTFRLPFSNLSEDSIICRIYYSLTEYTEWIIYSDTSSVEALLQGVSVKINVDRQKGIVNFTKGDSHYAIPQMSRYGENNIRILAKKEIKDGFKSVVSANNCVTYGSSILLSSGNKIYSATYKNPLYFPQSFNNSVGSPDEPITALITADDKVFAFKENRIYSVKINHGKNINKIALLPDNESIFFKEDTYEINCVESETGCVQKNKVTVINGNPIWQSKTGDVFVLSAGKVYSVSQKIKPYFESLTDKELSAVVCGSMFGYFILSASSKAVIMDYSNNAWYILELPQEIRLVGIDSKNALLLCVNEANVCFTASFDGEKDNIVLGNYSNNKISTVEIESVLKTKSFSLGNFSNKKKITRAYLQLNAQGCVSVRLGNEVDFADFEITDAEFSYKKARFVKLTTNLKGLSSFFIELKTISNFALGKAEIYFKQV